MPEWGSSGSVRGDTSNGVPYRDRSKLLKASRFLDFLRSTLSWWRSAMISASREARDLKSQMTTHQISLSISLMSRSIARFVILR